MNSNALKQSFTHNLNRQHGKTMGLNYAWEMKDQLLESQQSMRTDRSMTSVYRK